MDLRKGVEIYKRALMSYPRYFSFLLPHLLSVDAISSVAILFHGRTYGFVSPVLLTHRVFRVHVFVFRRRHEREYMEAVHCDLTFFTTLADSRSSGCDVI